MTSELRLRATTRTEWAARSRPARPLRIALVNMPWGQCHTPSIQCGLLKAGLVRHGHHVDVRYANLELAARIGPDRYARIAAMPEERQILLGDWLFTAAAYTGTPYQNDDGYLSHHKGALADLAEAGIGAADLQCLRDEVLPGWVTALAGAVSWAEYDVVGFTSTFAQSVAAMALARHVKERAGHVVTVLGGANADGGMGPELLRAFPGVIDYTISGEGDVIVPVFAAELSAGRSPLGLPGVSGRDAAGDVVAGGQAPGVEDMDALPEPDYTDYFAALDRLGAAKALGAATVRLLLETSRGCWWGAKHHCTFCGLNAQGMTYRAKSPPRVVAEVGRLVDRHRVLEVDAVDNILDMTYLTTVCRELAEAHWDLKLFYEVKANLSREQIGCLRRAGVTAIQPGLESLSTRVLGLMRKGSTMLTNVRLLKWSRYHGMHVSWNILVGFPGEADADYEAQIDLIPALLHLQPPSGVGELWLERFSPYFTGDYPLTDVRPLPAYRQVFPMPGVNLAELAYFFDYRAADVCSADVRARLCAAVASWRDLWSAAPPMLTYQRGPGWLRLLDTRSMPARRITLAGWQADAYERCGDKPHTAAWVHESLPAGEARAGVVDEFLERCVANRLMVRDDGRHLSLALPANGNW